MTHDLAKAMNWEVGVDYPDWGNNPLYLTTIKGGYLLPGETPKRAYERVSSAAASKLNREDLVDKFFQLLWKGHLIPSTPVMGNLGTDKGLPISCFGGVLGDDMYSIGKKNLEMRMLSKYGGGTSYDFSRLRPLGSLIKNGSNGTSDGIVPQMKSFDSTILGSKQGKTRRGAVALYLDIQHKEYSKFLDIRDVKGDVNLQCINIHQGAVVTDDFMEKVVNENGKERQLWVDTIKKRVKTGEPYLFFIDTANREFRKLTKNPKLKINMSNLCTEIFLPNDPNHTFVCCLSSMNLFKYDEWKGTDAVYLATLFLDAVMTEFIEKGQLKYETEVVDSHGDILYNKGDNIYPGIEDAVRFAIKSRALGLGTLGWHSYLQSKMIPFIGIQANSLTRIIFGEIRKEAQRASKDLAELHGESEWCEGTGRRNLTLLAIAPNRSSSKLAGGYSQGVEPIAGNVYVDDDAKGMHIRRNPTLEFLLESKGKNTPEVWDNINEAKGSVQDISILTKEEKEIFLTFKEINQLELVKQAGIRQEYLDQGQSLNLAFPQDAPAKFINKVHIEAWKLGLKSLYYFRSESNLRADSSVQRDIYSECLLCEG